MTTRSHDNREDQLTALYYPHTGIQSTELMKHALLLWDKIEYIAPHSGFAADYSRSKPGRHLHSKDDAILMTAGMNLLAMPYVPNDEERETAHQAIMGIVDAGIPEKLMERLPFQESEYEIYKEKLLQKTWQSLSDRNLAHLVRYEYAEDGVVPAPFGLLMMAALADACSGTSTVRLTDRAVAYNAIAEGLHGLVPLNPLEKHAQSNESQSAREYVVDASLRTLGVDNISLKAVLALREREGRENNPFLFEMRRVYHDSMAEYATGLLQARNKEHLRQLDNQLDDSLRRHLKELRAALRSDAIGLFNRDLLVSLTAVSLQNANLILANVPPTVAQGIGIALLTTSLVQYRAKRNKTLAAHPLGYLYAAKPVSFY